MLVAFNAALLGAAAVPSVDNTLPASLSVNSATSLSLTGFSIAPSSITTGSSADFSATIINVGNNIITDAQVRVYIYNSGGSLADSFYYTNVTIVGGEVQALTKSWSTGSLPVGAYTALSNVSYSGGTVSNTMNLSFSIAAAPTPPAPPSPGGGGGGSISSGPVIMPVSPTPPKLTPPKSTQEVQVARFSPMREAVGGDNAFFNPVLENPSPDTPIEVSVRLEGANGSLYQAATNVVLAPGEKRAFPFTLPIPADAPSGYYSVIVRITTNQSEIAYPTMVHVLPNYKVGAASVKRQLFLDYDKNETVVYLTVTNNKNSSLAYLQIYENVPDRLTDPDKVRFATEPSKKATREQSGASTVRWDLEDMQPKESRTIVYGIPGVLSDLSDYSDWTLAQMVAIEPPSAEKVIVRDLRVPQILTGETAEITLKIFNGASSRQQVTGTVIAPNGWKVVPPTFSFDMLSRTSENVRLMVQPPDFAPPGTYGLVMRMKYGDSYSDEQLLVTIDSPVVQLYTPPLAGQIWDRFSPYIPLAAGLMGVFGAASVGLYLAYRQLFFTPRFNSGRLQSLQSIGRLFRRN